MSAYVVNRYVERCHSGCPTTAEFTEWSCGCVDVNIRNDRGTCSNCKSFSRRRKQCGRPGRPGGSHR